MPADILVTPFAPTGQSLSSQFGYPSRTLLCFFFKQQHRVSCVSPRLQHIQAQLFTVTNHRRHWLIYCTHGPFFGPFAVQRPPFRSIHASLFYHTCQVEYSNSTRLIRAVASVYFSSSLGTKYVQWRPVTKKRAPATGVRPT